jgi:hypothetical protein
MSTAVPDQTSFYSLLNLYTLGVVCVWAIYVNTFQQFHGGHIVETDYNTLLKAEVNKSKMARELATRPIL